MNGNKIGAIKRAIENHIKVENGRSLFFKDYNNWYIGITNNVGVRKSQHKSTKDTNALHFKYWDAGTKQDAIEIERYFHLLGMKDKINVGNAKKDTIYVYVFKIRTNIEIGRAHV